MNGAGELSADFAAGDFVTIADQDAAGLIGQGSENRDIASRANGETIDANAVLHESVEQGRNIGAGNFSVADAVADVDALRERRLELSYNFSARC